MVDFDFLRSVVVSSGEIAMSHYDSDYQITSKSDSTPVTDADRHVHEFVSGELAKFGYPILSEEGDRRYHIDSSEDFWILDPIDGTKDFIQKSGDFSIMLAFVSRGVVRTGIVYAPAHDHLYWGVEGSGAYFECGNHKQKLAVSEDGLENGCILVSRNHLGAHEEKIAERYSMKAIPMGSAGYKMSQIAHGNAELYINSSDRSSVWDVAAADCILREAGGILCDLKGQPIDYGLSRISLDHGYIAVNTKNNLHQYFSYEINNS